MLPRTWNEGQENFKTALCGAIENGSFQSHHRKSLGLRLFWFCRCFVDVRNIHLVDFYDTHVNDIWLFQNKYLDPYIIWPQLTPSSDKADVGESSLQVGWLGLPFRVFSPEYFCPNHQRFARKISKISATGGGCSPPRPPGSYAYDLVCSMTMKHISR